MNQKEIRKTTYHIIEKGRREIIQTLKDLVSIPTTIGNECEGQKYMRELYSKLGLNTICFEADLKKVSQHKAFIESGYGFERRPNIIGVLEGSPSANSLILNGHVDVVSPEPVNAWNTSPWDGIVIDNRLYGRGTYDMKGGLLANYFALKSLLEAGFKPRGTVMLQSVIEEEAGGGGGTLACLLEGYTADGMIIPEPKTIITVASPGIYYFRVRVTGKPAHAGLAHTGVNAIGKMNLIYEALVALDEKRGREKHYPLFEKDSERSCHLNIGTYKAGDWVSTVAGWAEMQCRISMIPGENAEEIKNQVHQLINAVAHNDEWLRQHPPEVTWFGWKAEPWDQDPSHPFVTTFKTCSENTLGREVDIVGATWGLDTRFAQDFGIPTLTFGPDGGNIHGINEYVELDSLIDCVKVLASFIIEWCGVESN